MVETISLTVLALARSLRAARQSTAERRRRRPERRGTCAAAGALYRLGRYGARRRGVGRCARALCCRISRCSSCRSCRSGRGLRSRSRPAYTLRNYAHAASATRCGCGRWRIRSGSPPSRRSPPPQLAVVGAGYRCRSGAACAAGRAIEALLALPWAVPGTVFAIALATAFSVPAPWVGRVRARRHGVDSSARLSRSQPADYEPRRARRVPRARSFARRSAATLGAGRWRALRRVTLPLVRPRAPWPAPAWRSSRRFGDSSRRSCCIPTTPGRSRSRFWRASGNRTSARRGGVRRRVDADQRRRCSWRSAPARRGG